MHLFLSNILVYDIFDMFRTRVFIFRKTVYVPVWYSMVYMLKLQ